MVDKKDFITIAQTRIFQDAHRECKAFTMTSPISMASMFWAVQHITQRNIAGSIVECGVWKGGSMMMAAKALQYFGDKSRELYLYDTFEGIPEPEPVDRDICGCLANLEYNRRLQDGKSTWCYSPLEEVQTNMKATGYAEDKINYIKGLVEETIPGVIPEKIALLRLDTDWYKSTKHELKHLYPLLSNGGILIIDDFGHWMGARKAVNEYFEGVKTNMIEIDYTARMIVK